MYRLLLVLMLILVVSCEKESVPKPKAYLSLNYPTVPYKKLEVKRPYIFDVSTNATVKKLPKNWLKVAYPSLKASIDITYRPVNNNLKELLIEAEKLVFEHAIKADQISSNNFENTKNNVYGTLYDIAGNSASQVQFHVTDSTNHFLKASLFFKTKPNYDSILPAVDYLKKDMVRIMESLQWQK